MEGMHAAAYRRNDGKCPQNQLNVEPLGGTQFKLKFAAHFWENNTSFVHEMEMPVPQVLVELLAMLES
jgi:hypothetical protein